MALLFIYLQKLISAHVLGILGRNLTYLQWIFNTVIAIKAFASRKFVSRSISQTRIEPDVLFIIRETPKCNS